LATGTRLGRYEIAGLIGVGGMGEVYRARDTRLHRDVAVKVVREGGPEAIARLEREARVIAALDHPDILSIFDVGTADDGSTYVVTELLEGQTLRDRIGARRPAAEALQIARRVAEALRAAHAKGVVHRDLKPDNVFLTHDGRVKVLDFGVAHLRVLHETAGRGTETMTATASAADAGGTPGYMSPEQLRGGDVDARSDVFQLGILLYEMLAGRPPFRRETAADTAAAILSEEPSPLGPGRMSPAVARIVVECLRKRPEDRYQSAHDVALALDALSTPRTSHRWLVFALVGVVAAIAPATVAWWVRSRPAPLTERDSIVVAHLDNRTGDAIFDDTLRESLLIALRQSPFLDIVGDARVNDTLTLMRREPRTRLTAELAREVAERAGATAVIAGSITPLGARFVLTLRATAASTAAVIAEAQAEAAGREDVLSALGDAARQLRRPLGESLKTIERFDKPLAQATTTSLDALKAYSEAARLQGQGKRNEARSAARRAVQIDPGFAAGWRALYVSAYNLGLLSEAAQYAARAFALADRVTERERYSISDAYYSDVTRDLDKAIANAEQWTQAYPGDSGAWVSLAIALSSACRTDEAVSVCRQGLERKESLALRTNLSTYLINEGRVGEAQEALKEVRKRYPDARSLHTNALRLAFLQRDTAREDELLDASRGKPYELDVLQVSARLAAAEGRLSRAHELSERYLVQAESRGLKELAIVERTETGADEQRVGRCGPVARLRSTLLSGPNAVEGGDYETSALGVALAACGFFEDASRLAAKLRTRWPSATFALLDASLVDAAVDLRRSRAQAALDRLEPFRPYERCDATIGYLRGRAYASLGRPEQAAAEFETVQRVAVSFYPLARLELARALAASGNRARSRATYEELFALWKGADADYPPLVAARAEYARPQR